MKPSGAGRRGDARAAAGARRGVAALVAFAPALGLALACSQSEAPAPPGPAAVQIEVAATEALPDRREYVGNVRSTDRIEIRARVRTAIKETWANG